MDTNDADQPIDAPSGTELPPAGWFPDASGQQRWWDGQQWTEHLMPSGGAPATASTDPKTIAALVHASAIFFGFLGPLVGYLVWPQDPFIRDHSRQALNFQITVLIGVVISIVLFFVIIGFFTMIGILIADFVLSILAAIAASKGERYSYPMTINFLKT